MTGIGVDQECQTCKPIILRTKGRQGKGVGEAGGMIEVVEGLSRWQTSEYMES
jgi:hypothetical protein